MRLLFQNHRSRVRIASTQKGFTIIELMIATLVSSVILLVITFGVVHFTNDYYQGVNSTNTQTTTQNAIDAISQAIQFNASGTVATDGSQGIFCAGTQVFLYTMGKQLTGAPGPTNWGLYQLNNPSSNCTTPADTSGGTELLATNMRLAYLNLSQIGSTNVWQLELRVAYGDPDLLCRSSINGTSTGSCNAGATDYTASDIIQGNDVHCKLETGSQFCSMTDLQTAIGQRINN
jgi:prepilin-type N-terminal cleavage/methylation domain-containing protein